MPHGGFACAHHSDQKDPVCSVHRRSSPLTDQSLSAPEPSQPSRVKENLTNVDRQGKLDGMPIQPTSITSLATSELASHLASVCDELSRRTDHDAAELLRTLDRMGRSMGDLGRCLGAAS